MTDRPLGDTLDVDNDPADFATKLHLIVAGEDGRAFGASELSRRFEAAVNALQAALPAETPELRQLVNAVSDAGTNLAVGSLDVGAAFGAAAEQLRQVIVTNQ